MDDETAELVLATIDMHFRAGNAALTPGQLEDHKSDGVCVACADHIDLEAVIAARDLVTA